MGSGLTGDRSGDLDDRQGEGAYDLVLILEDLPETAAWLKDVVRPAFGDVEILAAASLGAARGHLQGLMRARRPPLALIDLGLPDGSGVDFIRELLRAAPTTYVVVATIYDDDDSLMQAMAAGAHGYLLKDKDAQFLVERLQGMNRDIAPVSPAMARRILEHFRQRASFMVADRGPLVSLTARETDVLRLVGRGLTLSEAGEVLTVSPQTLAGYLKTVYRKLGISSRAEAALEAARRQLI